MGTVGTSFRFKQDPDQIIYTITNVHKENVYNYEAPCGVWGWVDKETDIHACCNGGSGCTDLGYTLGDYCPGEAGCNKACTNDGRVTKITDRGSGCAAGMWPNKGGHILAAGSMAGKDAFMSDFLLPLHTSGNSAENSGGHMTNRRVRYSITLDKKIGDSPHAFHPITHHYDYVENYKNN